MSNFADKRGRAARFVLTGLSAIVAVSVVAHIANAQLHFGGGAYDDLTERWLYNAALFACAGIAFVQMVRRPGRRRVLGAFGLAILAWTLGDLYWTAALSELASPPFPSFADLGYLMFYPPAYAGIMLIIRGRVAHFPPSVWLDGLIVSLTCAAIAVALLIDPIMSGVGGTFAEVATNLAYPLGDIMLIVLVLLMVAFGGWRFDRQATCIAAGLATFGIADALYVERVAAGTYVEGTILDSLWLVGIALLAFACLFDFKLEATRRQEGWSVVIAPAACALLSMGVIAYSAVEATSAAVPLLAIGALFATFVRAGLTYRDVQALADARRQAATDELTGLPNRRWLLGRLQKRIDAGTATTLIIIDLNGFKEVNDTLGHQAGDSVLRQVARHLVDAVGELGHAARLGGDEFAILTDDLDGAKRCAARVHEQLAGGFAVGDLTLSLGACMGVATSQDRSVNVSDLLRCADVALYDAKRRRAPLAVYDPNEDRHSLDNVVLTSDLRRAIANEEITLVYQPKVSLTTGALVGVEALARWEHPQRGPIPPAEFVPLAETAGLMSALTGLVLRGAISQANTWLVQGRDIPIAVNVSASDLIDASFPDLIKALLLAYDVPPRILQLEITESELIRDSERSAETIKRLANLGVRVSLDDFGTGYSSLRYLQYLDVHELKIDRAFVQHMAERSTDAAIVRCAIDMAQALGLRAVGEGVEDRQSYDMLAGLGCDVAQGYGISVPLPASALDQWVEDRASAAVSPSPCSV